ncbi:MAG: hypothetical protein A2474_02110 [Elusimicrobia bacterium RIFOXYC2_FULL_34_12]|nr:MAG: hypothetical protein A2474_02110 [Elusimicrobia bacterium RIFOXYC2_FULL_34_12]OGS38932.1 MAG: hypothetical protein A2551_03835 [Elusimicrobia bacterium RIFOXYD2_FULL_34_30]HAM37907.1 prepilin peptidase [Elusimicrobiota bacterium]
MTEIFFFVIGLFFGSFANVCIRRIPYNKSIVLPASHCPKCLIPIRWKDNIPIVSFLMLKGKCRNCKANISLEYPIVELLTGLYFLLSYLSFGISFSLLISIILGFYLIVISFIDMHLKIVPDILSVSLIFIGIILSPINSAIKYSFLNSITGICFAGFFLLTISYIGSKIYKKEVMGGGDIKLLAAGGGFLGISNIFHAFITACFIGGFVGLVLILFKKKKSSDFIPFGPYISISIILIFFLSHFIHITLLNLINSSIDMFSAR